MENTNATHPSTALNSLSPSPDTTTQSENQRRNTNDLTSSVTSNDSSPDATQWQHLLSSVILPKVADTVGHSRTEVAKFRKLVASLAYTAKDFLSLGNREYVEQITIDRCLKHTLDSHEHISSKCIHDLCDTMITLNLPLERLKHQRLTADVKERLQTELSMRIFQYSRKINLLKQTELSEKNFKMVQCLLFVGADVNTARAESKETPLHDAAILGHFNTIKLLLAYGADIKAVNIRGKTPLDEAASRLDFSVSRMRCAIALVAASQSMKAKYQGFLRILKGVFPVVMFLFATTGIVTGLTLIAAHFGWSTAISAIFAAI